MENSLSLKSAHNCQMAMNVFSTKNTTRRVQVECGEVTLHTTQEQQGHQRSNRSVRTNNDEVSMITSTLWQEDCGEIKQEDCGETARQAT